jgi:hypothetical protein
MPQSHRAGKSFAFAVLWYAAVIGSSINAHAADALVDAAVVALSQLTDPARLAALPDDGAVEAQLGPALGWIHVARRHDVSPESLIARAFQRNGLIGEPARVTRESLLRNLARADGWELFNHTDSAHALAYGQPVPIPVGLHAGRLARALLAVSVAGVLQEAVRPPEGWDFGSLILRADDEPKPRTAPGRRRGRQKSDLMAGGAVPKRPSTSGSGSRRARAPHVIPPPIIYDEPLPVADP